MRFVAGAIGEAAIDGKLDMVTALHACDTATDDAIRFALKHEARVVALVPCCQAEVARLLDGANSHRCTNCGAIRFSGASSRAISPT